MVNTTFPIMDEVIWFQAMSEFLHQDCVKLIGTGGANKHSCTLRPLSILNMGSITTFLPTSLSIYLKWKLKKHWKRWIELWRQFFSPEMFTCWCDQLNEGETRRKPFCDRISYVGVSGCTIAVICFTFILCRLTSYFLILKTFYMPPIWMLLILSAHPFSGINSS